MRYFKEEIQSFVLFQAAGILLSRINPLFCFKQPVLYFKEKSQSFVLFQAAGALFSRKKLNPLFCFKQPVLYFKEESQSFVQFQAANTILCADSSSQRDPFFSFYLQVTETGWGEFEIVIKIYFQDQR